MRKKIFLLLAIMLCVSGCRIVNYDSVNTIIDTVLYQNVNLVNKNFEGYSLYLPQGTKIIDKQDYNLKIKNNKYNYFLYIDTISYHYKKKNSFEIDKNHFYTSELNNGELFGFIDIEEHGDYYFIVIMYNYAKIESYILKEDFNDCFVNMCSILSSIRFNDKVIDTYIKNDKHISRVEEFNIFSSKNEGDSFLKYEQEYDVYIDDNNDNSMKDEDHIDLNEN